MHDLSMYPLMHSTRSEYLEEGKCTLPELVNLGKFNFSVYFKPKLKQT